MEERRDFPVCSYYRKTHVRHKSRTRKTDIYKPPNINYGSSLNKLYNAIGFYKTLYKNYFAW